MGSSRFLCLLLINAGDGSCLPVAFLLLWLPGEALNSALSITGFISFYRLYCFFFFFLPCKGTMVTLEKVARCSGPGPECLWGVGLCTSRGQGATTALSSVQCADGVAPQV